MCTSLRKPPTLYFACLIVHHVFRSGRKLLVTFDDLVVNPCDLIEINKPQKIANGDNYQLGDFENITTIFGNDVNQFNESTVKAFPMHVLESEPTHYSDANVYDQTIDVINKIESPILNAIDAFCATAPKVITFSDISDTYTVDKSSTVFDNVPRLNTVNSCKPTVVESQHVHRVNSTIKQLGAKLYTNNDVPNDNDEHFKMVIQNGIIALKVYKNNQYEYATNVDITTGSGLYYSLPNKFQKSYIVYISTCSGVPNVNFKVNKQQQDQTVNELYMYKESTGVYQLFRAQNTTSSNSGSSTIKMPNDIDDEFTRAVQVMPQGSDDLFYLADVSATTHLMYKQLHADADSNHKGDLTLCTDNTIVFSSNNGYGFVNSHTGAFTYSPVDKFVYDEDLQQLLHNTSAVNGNAAPAPAGFYRVSNTMEFVNIDSDGKINYDEFGSQTNGGKIIFANTEVYTYPGFDLPSEDAHFSDLTLTLTLDSGAIGNDSVYINVEGYLCYAEDGLENGVQAGDYVTDLVPGVYKCKSSADSTVPVYVQVEAVHNGKQAAAKIHNRVVACRDCSTEEWTFKRIIRGSENDILDTAGVCIDTEGRVIGIDSHGVWSSDNINDDYIVIASGDSYILRKIVLVSDEDATAILSDDAEDSIAGPGVISLEIDGSSRQLYRIEAFGEPLQLISSQWVIDDDENTLHYVDETGAVISDKFTGHFAWPVDGELRVYLSNPDAAENADKLIWTLDENYDCDLKEIFGSDAISPIKRFLLIDMIENDRADGFRLGKMYVYNDKSTVTGIIEEIPAGKFKLNLSATATESVFLLENNNDQFNNYDLDLQTGYEFNGILSDGSVVRANSVEKAGCTLVIYEDAEPLLNRVIIEENLEDPANPVYNVYVTDEEGFASIHDFSARTLLIVRESNYLEEWTSYDSEGAHLIAIDEAKVYVGFDDKLYESDKSLEAVPVAPAKELTDNYLELDSGDRAGLVKELSLLFIGGAKVNPATCTMVIVNSKDHPQANGQYVWNGTQWNRYSPVGDFGAKLGATNDASEARALLSVAKMTVGAAPSETAAGDLWLDGGVLKFRNADNDGWIILSNAV